MGDPADVGLVDTHAKGNGGNHDQPIFAGDPIAEVLPPAVILCVGLASYFLRPADRRLASTAAMTSEAQA